MLVLVIHVLGDGPADGPPVVLTSGLAGALTDWDPLTRLLAPSMRVLRFDRPGYGASAPSPEAPSARREVAVLDEVLDIAGAPVVLVGHSLAGLHVEACVRLRPSRVCGAVLVDPSLAPPGIGRPFDPGAVLATAVARLGLADLAARCVSPLLRLAGRPPARAAAVAELAGYADLVSEVDGLRGVHPLPDVPWWVLTAGEALGGPRSARRILAAHEAMVALAPRGVHRIVPGSGHLMQLDRPDAVAEAVLRIRTGR
ncbi:pimeloyl-ACP methyl ester carboxylesterase [Lentzea atacamensis]|uniref:Pimeloyl-ACP methyl ester carboxylesterase n=1 Tax=Lentzea atacamensis TaxID=531938 RepID=A0ABX9EJW2_9PSEU|nr:alpha/beta hydrolase [Lentzea atacamensis]RAS70148.1 pimeloyl-ACP methyl ester carboxylesterase [Lentzea atacamensis]